MKPNDEVIYSIIVPGLSSTVKRQNAESALSSHGVPVNVRQFSLDTISVPRLYTRWRGDEDEQHWQQAIKADLPTAIIDVQPWSYGPGYPKGDTEL